MADRPIVGAIGVPCRLQGRSTLFHECVEELDRPDEPIDVIYRRNNSVAQARNEIAEEALARGAQWIWWLDDDLIFLPDALKRALQRPEAIVIGLSMIRIPAIKPGQDRPKFKPLWFVEGEGGRAVPADTITREPNGLQRLLSGTGGGVLTRREVFERVPRPWWAIGQYVPDMFFEDIYFYDQCRMAGFDIWGDPSVKFGHDTMMTVWPHEDDQGRWSTVLARGFEPILGEAWAAPAREEQVA